MAGGCQPPRTSRKAVLGFLRLPAHIPHLSQPVPTSDHPLHLVGESAAGSGATAGGGTGGVGTRSPSAAACAPAPRRHARRFLTPPRVPQIGHPRTATAAWPPRGRGRGRDLILDRGCGLLRSPQWPPRSLDPAHPPRRRSRLLTPHGGAGGRPRAAGKLANGARPPRAIEAGGWRIGWAAQEKRLGAQPLPRRCRPHRPPRPATPTSRAPSVGWRLAWSPLSSP